MEVAVTMACRLGSDDKSGPRVDIQCRPFDFTLLFEDLFFVLVPAAFLILLLPSRIRFLRHESVKVESYKLAIWKLVWLSLLSNIYVKIWRLNKQLSIACLFVLHVVFTAFQQVNGSLRTKASLASSVINIIAILAAGYFSFIEDREYFDIVLVLSSSLSNYSANPELNRTFFCAVQYPCDLFLSF